MHRLVVMNKKLLNFYFKNNRKQLLFFRRELKSLSLPKSSSTRMKNSRQLSQFNDAIAMSDEIKSALFERKPIVALESTIITHGMPFPFNLQTAINVEKIVRDCGVIPATIGVINGKIIVGMNHKELQFLANENDNKSGGGRRLFKVSRRDLPVIMANKLSGGTTVSATSLIAYRSGIQIFATGGIGGVHRGGELSLDISADLTELGRTPITIVSAGVKSILDIEKTLEVLETEGVCVVVFNGEEDIDGNVQFPSFFTRVSGCKIGYNVKTAEEAALMISEHKKLGLESGILIAVPIPERDKALGDIVNNAITDALKEAKDKNVIGKDVTPFVLKRVNEISGGRTLTANIALIENNARIGSEIALQFTRLINLSTNASSQPLQCLHNRASRLNTNSNYPTESAKPALEGTEQSKQEWTGPHSNQSQLSPVIIGGSIYDIVANANTESLTLNGGTYKGSIKVSLGGVGRNIFDCLTRLGHEPLFLSAVGNDANGELIIKNNRLKNEKSIIKLDRIPTSSCSIILDGRGECGLLIGDMRSHDYITKEHVSQFSKEISSAPLVVIDANIPIDTMVYILKLCSDYRIPELLNIISKMTSVSYHISNLLEKMTSTDKDFRFMATNDLMSELQKDSIKLDDDCEKKVVRMLLKLLEDKNGEVQNLAVKCLGPLVNKVKEIQVETIVDTLCTNMISNNEQLRDISSIGLKTVIAELSPSSTSLVSTICKRITGRLANAISQHDDVTIQLEALEILSDLLNRFGALLVSFHANIQDALIPQLLSQRLAVRKRAITAISYLTMCCSQPLYVRVIEFLLEELSRNASDSTAKTYIQCIAAISRQAGHRFGENLERVMPLIVKYCNSEDDELKEYCIQAFESFVRRCPKEISPHVSTIINVCLKYICYDPNYNYDDDDMDDEDMEMDNEDEDGDSNDEYSDDDDMSWKVRRSSAKALEALISTRHDMIVEFYRKVSLELISRYKEREENVKVDVFNAYIALLKQTRTVIGTATGYDNSLHYSENVTAILREQVPSIVKSLHKQLREKSIKTRQSSFLLLTELVHVLPGALTDHVSNLIPGILYSLSDKNSSSNMKIDTLAFLNVLLKTHNPEVFHKHVHILLPAIINAVADSFYKITSEALLVLTQIIRVIRPTSSTDFNFQPHVAPIYECTLIKLKAADIDQEVKERAITCMGQIISTFGDKMHSELRTSLPLLLDRLRNEITRLTCVKAITKIASSEFKLDLNPLLPEAFPVLASFLRKNQRALKLSTLVLIDTLVKNYSEYLSPETIGIILNEVPPLINESDLHISQLTLNMLTSLIRSHMAFLAIIPQTILPEALILVRSPLLQGSALNSMLEFFQAIVQNSFPGLDYEELVLRLTQPIINPNRNQTLNLHKQAYHSIAKCMSAISIIDEKRAINSVRQLLTNIRNHRDSDTIQLFTLLAIGEIGKSVDLSFVKDLKDVIMESFNSSSEEVKSAASFCLGSVSVGNLGEYLPFVLVEIENRQKRQYLLLHSLKEIISCLSANPAMIQLLEPHLDSIWKLLLNHCECPEEGTRNVVAECLGKLTLIDPVTLLPRLQNYLGSESPLARSTVVTAMKFTISDQPQKIDPLLRNSIGEFLKTLQDPDINVRRVALVAFNSAAHNKPSLIRDLLDSILPQLYNETKVRKELIREVEMGPFKHTVDDGLDIRKAAFECMYTLLDSCLDRIDIFEFLNHVEDGLRDHYDIKMLTYLMLVRLSTLCPSAILQRLERLVEPLKGTCVSKVKANAVKQEFEKQDELKRSAMRAFLALLTIPDADKNLLMTDFLSQIKTTPDLMILYETIQKDSTVSNDISPMEIN